MAASALGRDVQRLTAWASTTDSGDRDDLKPGVPDRSWSQVSVSARECLGVARCPFGVRVLLRTGARPGRRGRRRRHQSRAAGHRRRAESAVLPEHALLVVDEAHELADRVTSVATAELTSAALGVAVAADHPTGESGADRAAGGDVGHLRRGDPRRARRVASITSTTSWRHT